MASNPNIILQGQPVDTGNILNSFLVGRKLGQENRAIEKQNKLAQVLASTPREKLADTLYQQGMFKEAQDYSKNQADIAKTEAETGLKQFERKKKMLDASLQLANGYVSDPMLNKEKIMGGLNSLKEMGLIDDSVYMQSQNNIAQLPDDTLSLRQWAKQSMMQLSDANKALDMQFPDANAQLQAQTSTANAQLSAETQRRGQDMTAETQRGGQQFNYDLGMQRLENDRQKAALTGQKAPAIPAAIQSAYIGNKTALSKIDEALKIVESNPDAFGLKNKLGDTIMQRLDPSGVDARALIADIGSLKIHDRSGAAVTAAEQPRLKPFIPNVDDTVETIKKKLTNFKREYDQINQEYEQIHPSLKGGSSWQKPDDWDQFMQEMGGQ